MNRLATLSAALVLAACARAPVSGAPDGEPYVRGPVASFTHSATASNLSVRAGPGSREQCGISATVDARTRYLERGRSGALRSIERAAVAVGDTVEVYVDGPVAESCPVQAYAGAVVRVAGPN
jgi:hypothetical protein